MMTRKEADANGPFYADGLSIFHHPIQSETGVSLGFKVCEVSEFLSVEGERIGDFVARLLNKGYVEEKRK